MVKFLILGCNGMAGSTISLYLTKRGHDVTGFARSNSKCVTTIIGDALNFDKLSEVIQSNNYDCVVNCIGILNQFANDNPEIATKLNAELPHFLKQITEGTNTKVIHISIDCVFSGKVGGYTESSKPDETSIYGKTKADGEINDNKNITLRQSIVGPDIKKEGIGLFNWFIKQTGNIYGFKNVIWSGITTLELANVIEYVSTNKNAVGLVNMVNNDVISKFDLLNLFKKYTKRNDIIINENTDKKENKSLIRTNFNFEYKIPSYEEMVKEMVCFIDENEDYYLSYKRD